MRHGLNKLLVSLGVLVLVGISSAMWWFARRTGGEVAPSNVDAGVVSSPEVIAALAGAKKNYVGSWNCGGASHLDIGPRGGIWFRQAEGAMYNWKTTEGLIVSFDGNDIIVTGKTCTGSTCKPYEEVSEKISVSVPPQLVDARWEMIPPHRVEDWKLTANGVELER